MLNKNFNEKILIEKFTNTNIISNNRYFEIQVNQSEIFNTIKELKEDSNFKFDQLIDLTAIDYPSREKRFDVIYLLLSMTLNQRLLIKTSIGQSESIETVIRIHRAADWYEREAFDLFGILFDGHPDLRRILTDYGFIGHPFRKDFPLIGNTQVRYDPDLKRVIYEPVDIEPRVLVPKVIREK